MDPGILIIVLFVGIIILIILTVLNMVKMNKMHRKYDGFMRGKDAESLEDSFLKVYEDVESLKKEDKENKEVIKALGIALNRSFQKTAVVHYDAFAGMGGQFSFALTMLDRNDNGILLNCIHNRESCYLYLREIEEGSCKIELSKEEKQSLEEAKKKH
jgi:hypothetical protein